jgi:ElaB/YqjD/DUF883 family membrane-anchored ribosome-binding protein
MSPSPEVNPFPKTEAAPMGGATSATATTGMPDDMVNRAAETAHRAVDRVAEKATPAVERLRSGVNEATHVLQARADQLGEVQERWVAESRDYVREHPFASLAAALAAGMLLARLLWR